MNVEKVMALITKIATILLTLFFVLMPPLIVFLGWFFSNILSSGYQSLPYILMNAGILGVLSILSILIFGFLVLLPFYHYGFGLWKHKSRFFDSYSKIMSSVIGITTIIILFYSYILRPFSISIGDIFILILHPLTWVFILIVAIPFYYGWLKKPTNDVINEIKAVENNNSDSISNLEHK